ncbi:MAG: fumarylacetoacetate hydrolase family protein [Pontibacterium sp.]
MKVSYQHCLNGSPVDLPVGKIVCVGRNYAEHAAELNNPVPTEPLLFIKPSTCLVPMAEPVTLPQGRGDVHYETEMALLIGEQLTNASEAEVKEAILGVGIALDLTLRGLQSQLKEKGHPWERAKSFDGACPMSDFVPLAMVGDLRDQQLKLSINGEIKQNGNSKDMLNPVVPLIAHISTQFTLLPGDIVITGTPVGVGTLASGDALSLSLGDVIELNTEVA